MGVEIKIPVTVGKREKLLKAKDTCILLTPDYLSIKALYVKESPKDISDAFSPVEECRKEFECLVKKSAITDITWFWAFESETYALDVCIGCEQVFSLFMADRESAILYYEQIKSWLLT